MTKVKVTPGLPCPAPARAFEKGWFHPRSLAGNDNLKARHKAGLAMMLPSNFCDQHLPMLVEPSLLVTSSGFFQVRQGLVVFALACVQNADT